MSDGSGINFSCTGLWFFGYLLFVWLTPAQFNLNIFLIPLFFIAIIEIIEGYLKIQYKMAGKK